MASVEVYTSTATNGFLEEKKNAVIVSAQEVSQASSDAGSTYTIEDPNYLVVSPYTEQDHLLDLRTLDAENALLSKALVHMECLRPDYATSPYTETFNWSEVMEQLKRLAKEENHKFKETTFYIVAFRSQIPPTTVYADLGVLDKAAHAEATASGGFLK
jgi:hypothetical protein